MRFIDGFSAERDSVIGSRVVGYLPDWSYQHYHSLDFSALTHLNISFCNPDVNGEISVGIPDDELKKLIEKAHSNNVKVLAALGGGGGCYNYIPLLSASENMAAFNGKIMKFCEAHGFDGIDLDIELGADHEMWRYYGDWVSSLRKLCDDIGYILTTATAQWVAVNVSPKTFNLFDFVNVMAYDDDRNSESHASIEFAKESLRYFNEQRGVAKEKLVLGVPFYGRSYNDDGSLDWNSYLPFSELCLASEDNYNADRYNGFAYDGAATIRKKCAIAKEHGGIMIWEVSLDASGDHSLLAVIKEEMTGKA